MRTSFATLGMLATFAGCYAPEVRDCAVTCSGESSTCADDQVCGSDGFCASPEVAGHCEGSAPELVTVRVVVDGNGRVIVKDVGTCDSQTGGDCTWQFAPHTRIELHADGELDKWTQACAGQDAKCAIMPAESVIVGARFRAERDD